ncbi:MAG: hypothetical protein IPL95_09650 [Saprospiraceae bacterium]|jgi:hypothetical protein|nr:hypothetical protein [Saprospiraceae bacterium]
MEKYQLELTLEEINLIFKVLGERPFNEVFELIGTINEQVNEQIKALQIADKIPENE